MSRTYAYRLIDSADVCRQLATFDVTPQTESVVRPLVNLAPEDQARVWEAACTKANGQPTAEQVKETVKELVPETARPKRKKKSAAEKLAERVGMRIAYDGALVPADLVVVGSELTDAFSRAWEACFGANPAV